MNEIIEIIENALQNKTVIKIVFSKPKEKSIKKAQGRIVEIKGERKLQIEIFYTDGKARQFNHPENLPAEQIEEFVSAYKQINLFTTAGNCEALISKSGKCHILNKIKRDSVLIPASAAENNKEKKYILDPATSAEFLSKLGISNEQGDIYDRKRAKFKQINRFVEILDDCYSKLPEEGTLSVCDLCCGKSYLTFAVYHYLTAIKGRSVIMYGVDLKADVIDFCNATAAHLGYTGMKFICGNILHFTPEIPPHLVISLHACDIATDIVLYSAIKLKAEVILSTPCCHHEMMNQLSCDALSFVSKYSLYRQKMCDAFTDALRSTRLEAEGYKVSAIELIDPEETPKNILIRAIKANVSPKRRETALQEYNNAVSFLHIEPYLNRLLEEDDS